ncbi:hypothetical protein MSG28_002098 [Choristoneura fumiferana]|uniref:Uncharacterized protein n=1 Tax=Choristoneura fumiferana TaxID=7141 RepID=A0ACC0JTW8_CHOFU|nr:hypothetical protein MSG28_002098 [Choristoneura fumiferana]
MTVTHFRLFKMWFTYLVVVVSAVAFADAYSAGAPEGACQDMIPRHPVAPQKSPAPYTITTSTKVVKAGTPMEVVISGKGPSNTMRGLLLQARQGDKIVGKFTLPPNDRFAQLINCGESGVDKPGCAGTPTELRYCRQDKDMQ